MLVTSLAVVFLTAAQCSAAFTNYLFTIKGVTLTLTGDRFKFTASGTMTWDRVSGQMSFATVTSAGVPFSGIGYLGTGKKAFATCSFSSGVNGNAVFIGKFDKTLEKFKGSYRAASPNRLGPTPEGFVHTKGRAKATLL